MKFISIFFAFGVVALCRPSAKNTVHHTTIQADTPNITITNTINRDTFSVDGRTFSVYKDDTGYFGIVEQEIGKNNWQKIFTIALGTHNSYAYNKDVNGDGFNDFIHYWKWDSRVYFYNPLSKSFIDTGLIFPTAWTILKANKKIYCNTQVDKLNNEFSWLYTFHKFKPFYYYGVDVQPTNNHKKYILTLYKCLHGHANENVKIKQYNIQSTNKKVFDYVQYWKSYIGQLGDGKKNTIKKTDTTFVYTEPDH